MDVSQLPGVRKYSQKFDVLALARPTWTLIALLVSGLILRLIFLEYRFAVAFDEVNYLKLGVSGHLGDMSRILHTYWSPLLPACISLFCKFFDDFELAARLVSVLFGTLVVLPVYALGKAVFDEKTGLLAASFMAFFPPLAFQSTLILTEPLVMFFGVLSVLLGLRMLRQASTVNALLTGLSGGLAYLAHPLGLGFLLVAAAWAVFGCATRLFRIRWLRLGYLLIALAVGFLAVAAPYLTYLKQTTGVWTLSAKGAANQQMETAVSSKEDSFRSLNSDNTIVPIDLVFHQGTFLQANKKSAPASRKVQLLPFLVKYIKNFSNVLQKAVPQVLTTLPLMLFGIGLLSRPWKMGSGRSVLYLVSFLCLFWFVLVPAFHIHLRYLTPVWPICALFIGRGFANVHQWLADYLPLTKLTWRKRLRPSTLALLLLFAVIAIFSFLPETGRVLARSRQSTEYVADPIGQRRAGFWLSKNTESTPIVMSRNHAVDFYAGNYDIAESVTVPTNSLERILAYARHRYVTHIVLDERYLKDYPHLAFLIDGSGGHTQLKQVHRTVDDAGFATVIYEFISATP